MNDRAQAITDHISAALTAVDDWQADGINEDALGHLSMARHWLRTARTKIELADQWAKVQG